MKLPRKFDLICYNFDSINHLPNIKSLCSCFKAIRKHLSNNGYFLFDLSTLVALQTNWDRGLWIQDTDELYKIQSGIYLPAEKEVIAQLRKAGFKSIEYYSDMKFKNKLLVENIENHKRVFFIVKK
ncbi:MAG: hypothetical protein A2381_11345 [Bdellovibrionales bacterium RIFOXYB1_FULL_37_110]|nr:MAG: hypothetical protein A2417_11650 [Bdellovibrionales bacterium RIFOXYC1_FULL_37_79]OFZ57287.1 MAG: hypothetical protein A2381_11345 [Bdellovibrionales bacterium RIFOXYB1_FULL_37_110]